MNRKLIFLDIDGTLTPAGSNTPPESAMKAIRLAQAKGAVYVVDKDGMRDIRYVEIGLSVSDMTPSEKNRTVIRSGLSEGEKVILP